jgi:hypothetical protein
MNFIIVLAGRDRSSMNTIATAVVTPATGPAPLIAAK